MLRQAVFSSLITSSEGFSNDFNKEIFPKPHFCVFRCLVDPTYICSPGLFFFLKIFFFFLCEPFFKVFIEFVTILFLFYVLALWSRGLWDLSSLTRDQTCTPCVGRLNLNHQGSSLLWTFNSIGFWKGTDSLLPSHARSSSSLCHYFLLLASTVSAPNLGGIFIPLCASLGTFSQVPACQFFLVSFLFS